MRRIINSNTLLLIIWRSRTVVERSYIRSVLESTCNWWNLINQMVKLRRFLTCRSTSQKHHWRRFNLAAELGDTFSWRQVAGRSWRVMTWGSKLTVLARSTRHIHAHIRQSVSSVTQWSLKVWKNYTGKDESGMKLWIPYNWQVQRIIDKSYVTLCVMSLVQYLYYAPL